MAVARLNPHGGYSGAGVVDLPLDQHFMQQAVAVAERGRYSAPPNPWVGCVIVKEGKVIG